MEAKVVLPLGAGTVCLILAWVSFVHYHNTGVGWLFVVIGVGIVVLGLVLGRSKG